MFYDEEKLDKVFISMIEFDRGDARRIQHFTKVHSYARLIGKMENIDDKTLYILEAAAYLHDIGILVSEQKYGYQNGKLQEEEGPEPAGKILEENGFDREIIDRVKYLIGHHHTYTNIEGDDYQILVEADFIVNLFEDEESIETVRNVYDRIFKTVSGKKILKNMFGL